MTIELPLLRLPPLLLALVLFATPAAAAEMKFDWPVACTLGQSCWIVNYVDDDPSKTSAKDFKCGDMTYEGHDGTDIAIKDHKSIGNNISVLAAADGTVLKTRDSVEDGNGDAAALAAAEKARQGCGNAVLISHGNGWETLYCHMKKGSISVTPGQPVRAGDKLGDVGQSGLAAFAHVHFGVMHNGKILDPFTGLPPEAGCGLKNISPLWSTPVAYNPLMLYASGFSGDPPVYAQMLNDTSSPPHLPVNSPLMIFWILMDGAEPGDHISLKILDPEGKPCAQADYIQDKKKISQIRYIGHHTSEVPLLPGTYTGTATVLRELPDGQNLKRSIESTVIVDAVK